MSAGLGKCDGLEVHRETIKAKESSLESEIGNDDWRYSHSAVLVGHWVVVCGGNRKDMSWYSRVFTLDTRTWEWDDWGEEPQHVSISEFSMHLVGDLGFVYGGFTSEEVPNKELLVFDFVLKQVSVKPSANEFLMPRSQSAGEFLEWMDMIVTFGGEREQECVNDLVGYSVSGNSWAMLRAKGKPPSARLGHSSCLQGKYHIVFQGGVNKRGFILSNLFILCCEWSSFSWSELRCPDLPLKRSKSSLSCIGSRLYVLGGYVNMNLIEGSQLYVYDMAEADGVLHEAYPSGDVERYGKLRVSLKNPNMLHLFAAHSAVHTDERIIILGGSEQPADRITIISAEV